MKTLNDDEKNRNTIADDVKMKEQTMQQVEANHYKIRQRLAILVDDAEEYLEKATAVAATEGRVATTPAEAAEAAYVDDMVSLTRKS